MQLPEFQEFVEVRYTDLLRTAYLLTGDRGAAEDLVQGGAADHDAPLAVRRRPDGVRAPGDGQPADQPLAADRLPGTAHRRTARAGRPGRSSRAGERDELLTALGRLPVRMRAIDNRN